MSSTALSDRYDQTWAGTPELKWVAGALVIAALTFNAFLCIINTHVAPINNSHVIGSEIFIITIALLACHKTIEPQYVLIASIVIYTVLLTLIRVSISPDAGLDLKITRDFLIPVIFLVLGKSVNDVRFADRVVYVATFIVLSVAIFEYCFVDGYLKVFGIVDYYVARGSLDPLKPSLQWAGGLMLNGIRPEELGGRALLPFFGDHRVSSVFLEFDQLGQFRLGGGVLGNCAIEDAKSVALLVHCGRTCDDRVVRLQVQCIVPPRWHPDIASQSADHHTGSPGHAVCSHGRVVSGRR